MAKSGKADKWAARSARLSAALRANLKKRKQQARARDRAAADETGETAGPPAASAAQGPDFRRNQGAK